VGEPIVVVAKTIVVELDLVFVVEPIVLFVVGEPIVVVAKTIVVELDLVFVVEFISVGVVSI
jgi:hypothetical protein